MHAAGDSNVGVPLSQAGLASAAGGSRNPRSDQGLLDAARTGQAGAFAAIYRRYHARLLRLAQRLTNSENDAHDLVQDSFLSLLSSLPNLELSGPLRPYLSQVARNCFIKRLRTERRRTRRERDWACRAVAAGWSIAPEERFSAEVAKLVDLLPQGQQEVLHDLYLLGRTTAETAEARGLVMGTVKSRHHRALQTLGMFLGQGLRGKRSRPSSGVSSGAAERERASGALRPVPGGDER